MEGINNAFVEHQLVELFFAKDTKRLSAGTNVRELF
jgi:hypothetical protein